MKKCADCKFLDRTRSIYWRGMFGNLCDLANITRNENK